MNYYEDFPILTEEQYHKLQNEYTHQNLANNDLQEIIDLLFNVKNSLTLIQNDFNQNISSEITKTSLSIASVFESIKLLFPNINQKPSKPKTNIFLIINDLNQINFKLNTLLKKENRNYYKNVLKKLSFNMFNIISSLLSSLSKAKLRIYKYM